jgi:hypothetical protein
LSYFVACLALFAHVPLVWHSKASKLTQLSNVLKGIFISSKFHYHQKRFDIFQMELAQPQPKKLTMIMVYFKPLRFFKLAGLAE